MGQKENKSIVFGGYPLASGKETHHTLSVLRIVNVGEVKTKCGNTIACSRAGYLTSALLTLWAENPLLQRLSCIIGCLAASPVSTH